MPTNRPSVNGGRERPPYMAAWPPEKGKAKGVRKESGKVHVSLNDEVGFKAFFPSSSPLRVLLGQAEHLNN